MIISEAYEDIFSCPAQTLVNTVNVVGVAGKGLALAFRQQYPGWFKAYQDSCRRKVYKKEVFWLWEIPNSDRLVLSVPTKGHWRNPSRLEWIDRICYELAQRYEALGITSVAIPKLGCTNGGLDWADVRKIIYHYLDPIDLPVRIVLGPISEVNQSFDFTYSN